MINDFMKNTGSTKQNTFIGLLKPNTVEDIMDYELMLGVKNDNKISYRYNNYGFRCDDFVKNENGKSFLFAGCSETEGAANRLEDTWSKALYDKISESKDLSGFYSVAKSGLNNSSIIKNIFTYISNFGLPEAIFVLFTDEYRFLCWSEEEKEYSYKYTALNTNVASRALGKKNVVKRGDMVNEIKISHAYSIILISILEDFCKINNIKLYWSSWAVDSYKDIAKYLSLDSFVDLTIGNEDIKKFNMKKMKARDHIHYGPDFHSFWADKFYLEFINDKNN